MMTAVSSRTAVADFAGARRRRYGAVRGHLVHQAGRAGDRPRPRPRAGGRARSRSGTAGAWRRYEADLDVWRKAGRKKSKGGSGGDARGAKPEAPEQQVRTGPAVVNIVIGVAIALVAIASLTFNWLP